MPVQLLISKTMAGMRGEGCSRLTQQVLHITSNHSPTSTDTASLVWAHPTRVPKQLQSAA